MDVSLIFKIAAIGIVVSVRQISDLFDLVRDLFGL